jgi:hypothetical protein
MLGFSWFICKKSTPNNKIVGILVRMKTRTKGATRTAPAALEVAESTSANVQLGPESSHPPRLFVLPEDISAEARIISLTNPRYLSKDRYVVCPNRGFYEFKVVAAPKTTPRSWLLCRPEEGACSESRDDTAHPNLSKGYVTRTADLFIATPIDPLFLLLPSLVLESKSSEPPRRLFLSSDDYFERVISSSPHLGSSVRAEKLRSLLESRLEAVCETVEAGDETMYRLDDERLLKEMLQKAKKMAQRGLPASMEEKLVRKALEVPMLSVTRDDSSLENLENLENLNALAATSNISTPLAQTPDSQTTVSHTDSATSSFSHASTAATLFSQESTNTSLADDSKITMPKIVAPEGVADLLRLRVALDFICSNYITPHITEQLNKTLRSRAATAAVNFCPLDTHLAYLTKLRQEATAARSLGDYSRKRSMHDDEDVEVRAEKKRKMEEEKRKKAGESLGVKRLKKANISGMKKMSDFFKKQ